MSSKLTYLPIRNTTCITMGTLFHYHDHDLHVILYTNVHISGKNDITYITQGVTEPKHSCHAWETLSSLLT